MAFRSLNDLSYTEGEIYDRENSSEAMSCPDYPPGLCFCICEDDLEKAGAEDGEPGDTMRFAAMGEVTSMMKSRANCRIEIQIGEFAGEDGQFFDLSQPAYISLCGPELEKMGVEADCQRGDMFHLVGEARVESMSSSELGGEMVTMQITHLDFEENESEESREHMRG